MKRGTDHTWEIRKYNGDIALYARCLCGFEYCCSHNAQTEDGKFSFEQEIDWLYHYCPNCGARKKWQTETVKMDKLRFN